MREKSCQVFISYTNKDMDIALCVCSELEKRNISCWIAPRDIEIGENWANQIMNALANVNHYVILLSENTLSSDEVLKELTVASELKKNIYAICINGCEPTNAYKYHLSIGQRIGFEYTTESHNMDTAVELLVDKLQAKLVKVKLPKKQNAGDELRIVSYKELIACGISKRSISERLARNDKNLYPHIAQQNQGNYDTQWETYLSSYPQTFRYLVDENNLIVGNWSFVILSADDYRRAEKGQLTEDELDIRKTAYFMFGGIYYGYLLNFSINREQMSPHNLKMLFESFLDQLEMFAKEGIFFRKWCVNVFLPDYERFYESLGFTYLCPNKASGNMYGLDFEPYPENIIFKKKTELKNMYENKFKIKYRQLCEEDTLELEQLKEIANLIYETDPYIYPALFENKKQARLLIPKLIQKKDAMFCKENLFIAEQDGTIVGLILWKKGQLNWSKESFEEIAQEMDIDISPYFDKVVDEYIKGYDEESLQNKISLINCCISKNMRNLGVGHKMLKAFIRKHKKETMELCVLKENVIAVQLYKKNNFIENGQYQGFSIENKELPCLSMIRNAI